MPTLPNKNEISGEITTLFYSSSNFSAGCLWSSDNSNVKFSGKFMVNIGDRIKLFGKWIKHPKYGSQFEAESFEHDLAMDYSGLIHYLKTNPNFKGIGPVKAEKIASYCNGDLDGTLLNNSAKIGLKDFAKLSNTDLETLQNEWQKRKQFNKISAWLGKFGLTHNQVDKLITKYGNSAKSVLEKDPYILFREITGYGFFKADQIALKMGCKKEHPGRIKAAILYTINQHTHNGDCWIEEEDLISITSKALALDSLDWYKLITDQLTGLLNENEPKIIAYSTSGKTLIAETIIYKREKELFDKFVDIKCKKIVGKNPIVLDEESQEIINCLNTIQEKAVHTVINNPITIISGFAGSGKSFTVSTIYQLYTKERLSITMCAPTGKAAKRMEELSGETAYTIHRLLDYHPKEGWRINKDNQLEVDIVIVDEVSMCDVNLMWHLFDAINLNKTKVVLVGDHNQLPPVGPGNILRDLLDRKLIPIIILNQVVRQAGILKENCTAILSGKINTTAPGTKGILRPWYMCDYCNSEEEILKELEQIVVQRLPVLGVDTYKNLQVLAPWKKGSIGVNNLNVVLQKLIQKKVFNVSVSPVEQNKQPKLFIGDKIMQIQNDYDLGVMNGTVGFIVDVCMQYDENDKRVEMYRINFSGKEVFVPVKSKKARKLQLAFCCTAHKYQGSESHSVIIITHSSQSYMLHRNWFYTAVTRAQKVAIVLGNKKGINYAVKKQIINNRKTFMSVLPE